MEAPQHPLPASLSDNFPSELLAQSDRIVTKEQVLELTGLSSTSLWRLQQRGEFPLRRTVGTSRYVFLLSEIQDWMKNLEVVPYTKRAA